jgi:chromosome segregation ATPase
MYNQQQQQQQQQQQPRRYAYNNNRVFIEELTNDDQQISSGGQLSQRQSLPPIQSPLPLQQQQNQLVPISQKNTQLNLIDTSLELNQTQQRMKQLETRLQLTETSNRQLLEELVRLQNDLALTLRKNLDTLQEERLARQQLETLYRQQYDTIIQLSGRLKRTEDILQEDRKGMQSLIIHTKQMEQQLSTTQKDLFLKRDLQTTRLDELKIHIDDLHRSKDNLERSAYSLLDEIKALKSKVDMEALSVNAIGADLRNKTRKLEEDNRQQVSFI